MNYYNDNDAKVCAWLRELIKEGLIPKGEVDERSITDVRADDLRGFVQCHFFAGIGGWSRALNLAGWPETEPVWTGSCPCQPLSCAGKQKGHADERHLWPAFYRLISECKPTTVFGEQVASKDGREWFAGIRADLEGMGYAVGGADLCAASCGAPHIRQRLFWVADSASQRWGPKSDKSSQEGSSDEGSEHARKLQIRTSRHSEHSRVADSASGRINRGHFNQTTVRLSQVTEPHVNSDGGRVANSNGIDGQRGGAQLDEQRHGEEGGDDIRYEGNPKFKEIRMEHSAGDGWQQWGAEPSGRGVAGKCGTDLRMGDTENSGLEGRESERRGLQQQRETVERASDAIGFWSDAIWHPCRDGKARRISPQPALFPLAARLQGRVGLLRGAGNAIVPQVAAAFIQAYLET